MPDDASTENPKPPSQVVRGGRSSDKSEKKAIVKKVVDALQPTTLPHRPQQQLFSEEQSVTSADPPWTLQQFFNGEIDLDVELSTRFANMPLMSTIKFRGLGKSTGRGVATIATPDGSAHIIIDADKTSKVIQVSFTWASMLTLRFTLSDPSDIDRARWLELMRRRQGGLAFLWGPARWEKDYMICISRRYHTNVYAFSPNGHQAAIRMTPDVTQKLLDWLADYWQTEEDEDDDTLDADDPKLLTW